jgi:hypothetical protein
MIMLFVGSTFVIGVSVATITPQYTNAESNNDDSCSSHQTSDNSKKCSKNDTPMILPFP